MKLIFQPICVESRGRAFALYMQSVFLHISSYSEWRMAWLLLQLLLCIQHNTIFQIHNDIVFVSTRAIQGDFVDGIPWCIPEAHEETEQRTNKKKKETESSLCRLLATVPTWKHSTTFTVSASYAHQHRAHSHPNSWARYIHSEMDAENEQHRRAKKKVPRIIWKCRPNISSGLTVQFPYLLLVLLPLCAGWETECWQPRGVHSLLRGGGSGNDASVAMCECGKAGP